MIKASEASKQQQINEAEGAGGGDPARSRSATAEGIRKVAEAIQVPGGFEAVQLRVAEQYIEQFGELAKEGNTADRARERGRRGVDDRARDDRRRPAPAGRQGVARFRLYHCRIMPEHGPDGWERNVWALALVVFIAFVGFQFFSPFLPLYVIELGVTEPTRVAIWSGVLTAVTPAVSGLLGPLWGRLADRVGRKMMMIRSLAGFVIIVAAMGLVTSVPAPRSCACSRASSPASRCSRWPWRACRARRTRCRWPSGVCRARSS